MLEHELTVFLYMLMLGAFLFASYMVVVIIKLVTRKMLFLHVLLDMAFSTFGAIIYYYVAYIKDYGNVRAYGILGMIIGIFISLFIFLAIRKIILQKVFTNANVKGKI